MFESHIKEGECAPQLSAGRLCSRLLKRRRAWMDSPLSSSAWCVQDQSFSTGDMTGEGRALLNMLSHMGAIEFTDSSPRAFGRPPW